MADSKHIVIERGPKDALILHYLGDAFSGNARLTLEGDAESGEALLRYALKLNGAEVFVSMKWQPIETAPRDGSAFLIYCGLKEIDIATWMPELDGFVDYYFGQKLNPELATHWMPLPEPPNA